MRARRRECSTTHIVGFGARSELSVGAGARDRDRKAGSERDERQRRVPGQRKRAQCAGFTALSRNYNAFRYMDTNRRLCYMGSLIRAILALSPRDVGSIPKRKKKPTVPQSEFVYSAFGCRAVAMSSNICEYRAFKLHVTNNLVRPYLSFV